MRFLTKVKILEYGKEFPAISNDEWKTQFHAPKSGPGVSHAAESGDGASGLPALGKARRATRRSEHAHDRAASLQTWGRPGGASGRSAGVSIASPARARQKMQLRAVRERPFPLPERTQYPHQAASGDQPGSGATFSCCTGR
jgi:hypothetical protein